MKSLAKASRGFTLIEILIVIGIIAILASVVIIAINPAKQFAQARNTQRESNINTILNAIGQNVADNKGMFNCDGVNTLPVNTIPTGIDNGGTGAGINLSCLVPIYIPAFPIDPSSPATPITGYTVAVSAIGRVVVCAPLAAEPAIPGSAAICVTR